MAEESGTETGTGGIGVSFDNNILNAEPGALASDRNREYYEAMYISDEEEEATCSWCGANQTTGLLKVDYRKWICENCESQPENNYDPNEEPSTADNY